MHVVLDDANPDARRYPRCYATAYSTDIVCPFLCPRPHNKQTSNEQLAHLITQQLSKTGKTQDAWGLAESWNFIRSS